MMADPCRYDLITWISYSSWSRHARREGVPSWFTRRRRKVEYSRVTLGIEEGVDRVTLEWKAMTAFHRFFFGGLTETVLFFDCMCGYVGRSRSVCPVVEVRQIARCGEFARGR